MFKTLYFLLFAFVTTITYGQSSDDNGNKKGSLYVTWGYHRDHYTSSTIHFVDRTSDTGSHYDFTFHNAKAKDQPDFHDLFHTAISIPQYVFNVGYFFNDKHDLGIEVSWDHLKYVVTDNQMIHVTGTFQGKSHNIDTLVTPNFVHYEHTNGNNYLMISLVKRLKLMHAENSRQSLSAIFKAGAGVLDPKTESHLFQHINDGPFRISGLVFGVSASLRYNFLKYFFLEGSAKGAYADYTSVKLFNTGRATQQFGSVQFIGAGGLNFNF